jgi:hypothetical protein
MGSPAIIAVVATIVTVVAYSLAGRIANRLLRGAAQLGSVLAGVGLAGLMASDPATAAEAGEYYLVGIVICVIAGKLLRGGRNKP